MQNTPPVRVRNIRRAVTIWAVVTALMLIVFFLISPHFIEWGILPQGASDRSGEINNVLWIFTLLSIPVFAFVVVFALYSIRAWGSRVRPQLDTPAVLVNPRFQGIWLVVSLLLVVFLYIYGLAFLNQVDAQPGGDVLQVNVTGEQWLWDYSYPQYGNVASSQLYLVVNRPVTFTITSVDVQHSFWIPSFGIKEDAVPGEVTHISVTPQKVGDYVVRCAELCGLYHSYMETPVHVVTQDQFNAIMQNLPTPVPTPTSSSYQPPDIALIDGAGRRLASAA